MHSVVLAALMDAASNAFFYLKTVLIRGMHQNVGNNLHVTSVFLLWIAGHKIGPGLNTCDKIKATTINVSLTVPHQSTLSQLPELEERPFKTDAWIVTRR